MRYLLDTHALIWYSEHSGKLPRHIEEILDNPESIVYVSAASLWEIAIKVNLGKLDLSFYNLLEELESVRFRILQVENVYLTKLLNLPRLHKDPFDRLIIATALAESLTLITADENIHAYDVDWVW